MTVVALIVLTTALVVAPAQADPLSISGRINSTAPWGGLLYIEEVGVDGIEEMVRVDIADARVVRVWRDEKRPWIWRSRETAIHRWPAGTFVVVISSGSTSGAIRASRVEIPRLDAR